jgi:purine-binding chemotaxis protein CheW
VVGLIVDSVSEVLRLPKEAIEPPPSLETAIGAEFIQGVGRIKDRLLTVLDLDRLLTPADQAAIA